MDDDDYDDDYDYDYDDVDAGRPFKMKGKRYLEVCLRVRESSDPQDPSQASMQSSNQSNDATIWSTLTFGYFGGQSRKSPASPSSTDSGVITSPPSGVTGASPLPLAVTPNGTAFNPSIGKSPLKSVIGEILFIQDRSYLIIVKPEAGSRSSNTSEKKGMAFKVFAVAPLMYTDASVDPHDRSTLRLVVRAWEGDSLPNMEKIGSGDNQAQTSSRYGYGSYVPTLLPARRNTCLFQINIGFEYQQACALAAEHIEGRKNMLREERLKMLKKALAVWTESEQTPASKV
jgi:hypothetical protein